MTFTQNSGSSQKSAPSSSANAQGTPPAAPIAAFMLIGKTGAGKSSFIRLLGGKDIVTGEEPTVGDGSDSCTLRPTAYEATVDNKKVMLLDTPGFDDSANEDLQLLKDILAFLYTLATDADRYQVHGAIFLHDINEVRFTRSSKKTFSILKEICGGECMGNVIVGTTMWSRKNTPEFAQQEQRRWKLFNDYWNGAYKTTRLPHNDRDAVIEVITDLLAKPSVLLQAQKELLPPPHSLENTTVGKFLLSGGGQRTGEPTDSSGEGTRGGAGVGDSATGAKGGGGGGMDALLNKLRNPGDMSFAEKFGLAVAAPIVLAPAALVSAPVGVIFALVHLAKKAGG